jgi:phosphatidylethanolamine/phosphatidyl-N-methylethanolamine N-methyltransferase
MSRIGWFAPLYDPLLAPLERRALGRWRRRAWAEVPREGLGLEIGSGTGANFGSRPPEAHLVGVDPSWEMLRRSRVRPDRRGSSLVGADAQALPFADGTFDWAVATLVFCEVPDPVLGLREVRRVLKAGRPLVLLEHVRPSGWRGRLADALTTLTAPLAGEHFDRRTDEALAAAGFEFVRKEWLWSDVVVLLVGRAPAAPPEPRSEPEPRGIR